MLTIATFGLPRPAPAAGLAVTEIGPHRRPNLMDNLGQTIGIVGRQWLGLMTMVTPGDPRPAPAFAGDKKERKFRGIGGHPSARLKTRIFSPGRSLCTISPS
ncbi:hypothetical protein MJ579_13495 [Klebsiella pneumoniae]|nr:hypothetical protein MJ579_13495 [Klebsiella pneumoniae]